MASPPTQLMLKSRNKKDVSFISIKCVKKKASSFDSKYEFNRTSLEKQKELEKKTHYRQKCVIFLRKKQLNKKEALFFSSNNILKFTHGHTLI